MTRLSSINRATRRLAAAALITFALAVTAPTAEAAWKFSKRPAHSEQQAPSLLDRVSQLFDRLLQGLGDVMDVPTGKG